MMLGPEKKDGVLHESQVRTSSPRLEKKRSVAARLTAMASVAEAAAVEEKEDKPPEIVKEMKTPTPVITSTPAKQVIGAEAAETSIKDRNVSLSIFRDVAEGTPLESQGKLFRLRRCQAVEMTVTWGEGVEHQATKSPVRSVNLYRTRYDWLVAIGRGVGQMPVQLMIEFIPYEFVSGARVGFGESWITAHDERGKVLGWYHPRADAGDVDPQPL